MSLSREGLSTRLYSATILTRVLSSHPLITLANALPWADLVSLIEDDLRKTTAKGFWWKGRRLILRVHLAVYIIQSHFNLTDRETEEQIMFNATYQTFCGVTIIKKWKCPDHSKIEEFRNRLSPETQRQIAIIIAKAAQSLGYANPKELDIDSTVQEANMAYPSDANLMVKLASMGKKAIEFLKKNTKGLMPKDLSINIASIKSKLLEYFFKTKRKGIKEKRRVFKELHQMVKKAVFPIIKKLEQVEEKVLKDLPGNIRKTVNQIRRLGRRYLLDVAQYVRKNKMKAGKILSFHLSDVACIKKGKIGKPHEFGRVFQLGRIGGNFLIPFKSSSVKMNDRKCFGELLDEYVTIFGKRSARSVTTDKGYYSKENVKKALSLKFKDIGIQYPGNIKSPPLLSKKKEKLLKDRRAGIEPLIGHVKNLGLRKSRAKSDRATLASGYRSVTAFNLRQLKKCLILKAKKKS